MDFAEKLNAFVGRVKALKSKIKTEEATKTSMIMPFFNMLGYDVFNPLEFIPEYTADVGIKKGEKVDYAIVDKKQNPVILIEAKCCGENLNKHGSQLFRYFAVTPAKFGILTNGIVYQFYTDLEAQNKMDKTPFLVVNLLSLKDDTVSDLQKFQKSEFDVNTIIAKATELKYSDKILQFFLNQIKNPDSDFISYVIANVYRGRKTQRIIDDFRPIVKRAFTHLLNEKVNERLQTAINAGDTLAEEKPEDSVTQHPAEENWSNEFLEGFFVIKSLIYYCAGDCVITRNTNGDELEITLENDKTKWICRLNFKEKIFYMNRPSNGKEYTKRQIRSLDDIYPYKNQLCEIVQKFSQKG